MFEILKKIFPIIIFGGAFIYVVFKVPYPETLVQANTFQIFSFFTPLFLTFTFLIYLFVKNFFLAISISTGFIIFLILKALDILNLITGSLTIIICALLISYFRKNSSVHLTKGSKIPKLTSLRRRR